MQSAKCKIFAALATERNFRYNVAVILLCGEAAVWRKLRSVATAANNFAFCTLHFALS